MPDEDPKVRLPGLAVFKRYSLALRQETAPAEEFLDILERTAARVREVIAQSRPPELPPPIDDLDDIAQKEPEFFVSESPVVKAPSRPATRKQARPSRPAPKKKSAAGSPSRRTAAKSKPKVKAAKPKVKAASPKPRPSSKSSAKKKAAKSKKSQIIRIPH